MNRTDNPHAFMHWLKQESERLFETQEPWPDVAGFQFQRGTKWRPGLDEAQLAAFQSEMGFEFPDALAAFYRTMNGTDRPGITIGGTRDDQPAFAPIYFSYPDHLRQMRDMIQERIALIGMDAKTASEQDIPAIFPLMPYYFLILDGVTNPVYYLSPAHRNHDLKRPYIYGSLWTDSLQQFLIKTIFLPTSHSSDLQDFPERRRESNFWTTGATD